MFPSQFQNDDIFQQLLVFLKNKDQEIGKTLGSQTADLCNLPASTGCMQGTFAMNQHIFRKFPWPFLVQNILF